MPPHQIRNSNGRFVSQTPAPDPEITNVVNTMQPQTPTAATGEEEEVHDQLAQPSTQEQLAALQKLVGTLVNQFASLPQGSIPPAPLASNITPAPSASSVTSPPALPFIPPPSAAPIAGACTSLRSLFPEIEAATITAVITHELRPADLYKLDSRYRDKEPSFGLNTATGLFEVNNRAAKDYKSFNALYTPLVVYLSILSAYLPNQRTVPLVFFQFLIHLQKISMEYEWAAVLEYTMAFMARRRMEMAESGDYSKWAIADTGLMTEHVFGNKKLAKSSLVTTRAPRTSSTSLDPCRNFNAGKCTGPRCPYNHPHVCSKCGKDHPVLDHPKST